MKKATLILGIVMMSAIAFTAQSCENQEESQVETTANHDNSDGHHDLDNEKTHSSSNSDHSSAVKTGKDELIRDYLVLKNALTKDNEEKAGQAATKIAETIKGFDASVYSKDQQSEIKDILETASTCWSRAIWR